MGNLEKLVVLTLLFLSAIVLAVSLNEGEVEAGGPVAGGDSLLASTDKALLLNAELGRPELEENAKVRSRAERTGELPTPKGSFRPRAGDTGAERTAGESPRTRTEPKPSAGGKLKILRHEDGLASAPGMEEFRVYDVQENDTWSGLAERFYSDTRYMPLLRSTNEELVELQAGLSILVPVYDFTREAGRREPHRPREIESVDTDRPVAGGTYLVREGDILSTISQEVYGTSRRWNEIYEANRDQLESPDWLKPGMKLVLPK